MYVAMTRARNELLVTYPMNTYASRWSGDYSIDQLSRFLDRGVRETMQRVVVGVAESPVAPTPPTPPGGFDLRAALRERFRTS